MNDDAPPGGQSLCPALKFVIGNGDLRIPYLISISRPGLYASLKRAIGGDIARTVWRPPAQDRRRALVVIHLNARPMPDGEYDLGRRMNSSITSHRNKLHMLVHNEFADAPGGR